jgi:hypothetical protein
VCVFSPTFSKRLSFIETSTLFWVEKLPTNFFFCNQQPPTLKKLEIKNYKKKFEKLKLKLLLYFSNIKKLKKKKVKNSLLLDDSMYVGISKHQKLILKASRGDR